MNPLKEYPQVRQWAYRVVWGVGLLLGAIQIYTVTVGEGVPAWVTGALAVLAYVSVATNYTADVNVAQNVVDPEPVVLADVEPTDLGPTTVEMPAYPPPPADEGEAPAETEVRPRNELGVYDTGGVLLVIAAIVVIVAGVLFILKAT
jgi:hypothetical protein